jgi:hypothetical protein
MKKEPKMLTSTFLSVEPDNSLPVEGRRIKNIQTCEGGLNTHEILRGPTSTGSVQKEVTYVHKEWRLSVDRHKQVEWTEA